MRKEDLLPSWKTVDEMIDPESSTANHTYLKMIIRLLAYIIVLYMTDWDEDD